MIKGYYTIDKLTRPEGVYELLENERLGDEAPCIVTKNGTIFGETWDTLREFLQTIYGEG